MDDVELHRRARECLASATQPLYHFVAAGSGERCALCDLPIDPNELEDEMHFAEAGAVRVVKLHAACTDIWETEQTAD